jgi:dienelactone hydrolase
MKSVMLLAAFAVVASIAAAQPGPREVTIPAPDGVPLKGTYFAAEAPAGGSQAKPAVILMAMCVANTGSWEPVAKLLSASGITALAMNNRPSGDSGTPRFQAAPDMQRVATQPLLTDFDVAFTWLTGQPGVDRTRIGAAGASCGVDSAVQLARRHPAVRSIALLAGPTDIGGIRYLQANPWLPIFTAAAADDEYDPRFPDIMRWLAEITGNPRNKFVGFKDGRHGTEMFGPHPELVRQIATWFDDTLIKSPASPVGFAAKKTDISEFWAAATARGGSARAVQLCRQARQRDANAFLFPEFMLNQLAYTKLQGPDDADKAEAVELFKLNAEVYPKSANAQDSLADAYIARGQKELALAAEEKCLELLKADTVNEVFKAQLRGIAEQKIARLKGGSLP